MVIKLCLKGLLQLNAALQAPICTTAVERDTPRQKWNALCSWQILLHTKNLLSRMKQKSKAVVITSW